MRAILIFLAALSAQASTIRFTAPPQNTLYGTYNGFATATVDGIPGQFLFCDDYLHTTLVPSGNLLYNVSYLVGSKPLEFARFAEHPSPTAANLEKYRTAALLLDSWTRSGTPSGSVLNADYQYALWNLFTPSLSLKPSQQFLLDQAAARLANPTPGHDSIYSRLTIYTPRPAYASNQEFLQYEAVPEPAAMLLIGGGLLAFGVVRRRAVRQ
jgi:hypothetical protein